MTWYPIPFEVGRKYRVKTQISYLGHDFRAGGSVEFTGDSYDAKQGLILFWFKDCESGDTKAWHVWDNGPTATETWHKHFALME